MMISASVIEGMLAAGATCETLAVMARQHFPDLAPTVDELVAAGTPLAVVAAMLTACAADAGAAARETERREANTQAQRKCRAKKDAAKRGQEPGRPLSSCHMTAMTSDDSGAPPPPSSFPPHPPNNYPHPLDDEEGARVVSLISVEAHELASEVAAIAGIDPDPKAWPSGWCGTAMRVQSWLNAGWPAEAIRSGVRAAMASDARKRDGPPATPFYFEKPIRQAIAQLNRPPAALPIPSSHGGRHGRTETTETRHCPAGGSAIHASFRRAAERRAGTSSGGSD